MWTPLIMLRKKTLLKLKFWFKRKEQETLFEFPSPKDFFIKADEVETRLLEAERKGDQQEIQFWKGAMSIIDYVFTKNERITSK